MRVARYREASEKAPTQPGVLEAAWIGPEAPLHVSTVSLTAPSTGIEFAPIEEAMHKSAEGFEDHGLSFTAIYKKGYGDE